MSTIQASLRRHQDEVARYTALMQRLARMETRISALRLTAFLAAAIAAFAAFRGESVGIGLLALALVGLFVAGVVAHAKLAARQREARVRSSVHERYIVRMEGRASSLPTPSRSVIPPDHPYASDIDLAGGGSLLQRIDVSQTVEGETSLVSALSSAATIEIVRARQDAVRELGAKRALCEEVEALGALHGEAKQKLDHGPFMGLFAVEPVFAARRWLRPVLWVLSPLSLFTVLAALGGLIPTLFVWPLLLVQGAMLWRLGEATHRTMNVVTARLGFADAYASILQLLEKERFESTHLRDLQESLTVDGKAPSSHLHRLRRYEGFAQLRTQGPLYIVLNLVTMWDLWCLERIESFVRSVGPSCETWFRAVGELEMLSSLACLAHTDPDTCMPEVVDSSRGLAAEALAHPLLHASSRVRNDVAVDGSGHAVIITGSNMAGKSTLLRAVGLNVALALAGGPVCARRMSLPCVRLRASMRIDDSLQRGASYFHAELSRLRTVVEGLDREPPVFFLLDELLRGTNARARHEGARAVLLHLMRRGGMGLVATHDIALSELERELPTQVVNMHFTDVFEDGEMRFDYKLRPGVVKTSNALRLLAMAGVDVEVSDAVV